ncbi:hypothetical protein SAMN05444724_3041 [Salinivibrio sp. ES.052]|nr:hypothetical protein SAMN05444724_3041 [Salinivibrio sp. ES.052]
MKLYNVIKAYLVEAMILGGAFALGVWLTLSGYLLH